MGPLSSMCSHGVVGYRGYSVGFCLFGRSRVSCRIYSLSSMGHPPHRSGCVLVMFFVLLSRRFLRIFFG